MQQYENATIRECNNTRMQQYENATIRECNKTQYDKSTW